MFMMIVCLEGEKNTPLDSESALKIKSTRLNQFQENKSSKENTVSKNTN